MAEDPKVRGRGDDARANQEPAREQPRVTATRAGEGELALGRPGIWIWAGALAAIVVLVGLAVTA